MFMNETWDTVYNTTYYKNNDISAMHPYKVYKREDLIDYGFDKGQWVVVDFWPWEYKQISKEKAFMICL